MFKKVDFHMHTTHSDGTLTPTQLMQRCAERGLTCVSLTDHDTMTGIPEAAKEAAKHGLELIPGIEISAIFEPGTLHILGYFLNREHAGLKSFLEEIQKARRERNPRIIKRLNEIGIDITLEEVIREANEGGEVLAEKQLGRPHFAKVLVKKKIVANSQEAFNKYLGKGAAAYMDKRVVTSKEAIRMIREAGGIASIAHPKQMKIGEAELEKEFQRFKDEGLEGVEVYNSCQNPEENKLYLRLAKKFDLVATGGSDFHGANKPGVELGVMGQDVRVGYDMVDALRTKIRNR